MSIDSQILAEFAPRGTLRVALNHGNRILVGRNGTTPFGISVDLATELASTLGLDFEFVEYERAVDVSDSATKDEWDVCFLAVDPKRAETIDFTAPYVKIEGSYLASAQCNAADAEALVKSGVKVGSVVGSAYSLTLERKPGAENLVMYADIFAMLDALDRGEISAAAGIGAVMQSESTSRTGSRVLQPPFMEIRQAMAIVKGRPAAAAYLRQWLDSMARTGRTGDILERHSVSRTCAVVPE